MCQEKKCAVEKKEGEGEGEGLSVSDSTGCAACGVVSAVVLPPSCVPVSPSLVPCAGGPSPPGVGVHLFLPPAPAAAALPVAPCLPLASVCGGGRKGRN